MDFKFRTDLRTVIFDFDGVINDSVKLGIERITKLAAAAGHKIPEDIRERLPRHWGIYGPKMIKAIFDIDDKASNELYKEWERVDATDFFPLILNAKETIQYLRNGLNLKIGMLTSRNRQNLMDVINYHGLSELFDAIQCRDDCAFVKPDPLSFNHILNLLNVPKDACIYVGDTIGDLQAATGACIRFVGVETGFLRKSDWQAAGLESKNILADIGWLPVWILKHF